MKTSARGIEIIKRYEGFSPTPYRCPAGWWTIGYGSTRGVTKDTAPVNEEQAAIMLQQDLAVAERGVSRLITAPLHQLQFDALVSFTYNLGGGALQRSSLRKKVNREEHGDVPNEFKKWVYAGGRKLNGLISRRLSEANLYMEGFNATQNPTQPAAKTTLTPGSGNLFDSLFAGFIRNSHIPVVRPLGKDTGRPAHQ